MKLSIIIPVLNEENTIEKLIRNVESVPIEKEIIVVDDGSTDNTKKILKKLKQNQTLKFFITIKITEKAVQSEQL